MEPYREAEVRARVAGIVTSRLYEEGQDVKRGDALFQIDPAPLQAAYDSEAANLARAQASLSAAADKLRRYADLVGDRAISERDPPSRRRRTPGPRPGGWRAPTCKAPS